MKKENFNLFYLISLGFQFGFSVVLPLVILIWGGVFLDRKFQTFPFFVIVSLVLCFFYFYFQCLDFFGKKNKKSKNKK